MSTTTQPASYRLDPVTFEVLRNALISSVDQMAEQILRTCHSFTLYCRDFSSALCDEHGNTVAQGTQDIASHVGTLHFTAKSIIDRFSGDINPGDVFAMNDPYVGGTHFSDVRIVRPIFAGERLLGFSLSNGHWADIGGSAPGSFDVDAHEHFGEGVRIPAVRIVRDGRLLEDVIDLILCNTRAPEIARGDLDAQIEATAVGSREVLRLVDKYGVDTIRTAFEDVQDYVETLTRRRIASLPDGTWETEDYIDADPALEEGLIPIRVKLTIDGDRAHYDLTGTHPSIRSFLNSSASATFSSVIAGTKCFFPDVPLNSGFYRAVTVDPGPAGSVVNAEWPVAVTGFCAGPFEKIMNSIFELWGRVTPDRAIACSFNLEYFLVGGRDSRQEDRAFFMWYDWMVGGWGGRVGQDGMDAGPSAYGVGLKMQPVEGQERLCPVLATETQLVTDSGGPGRFRGGAGVRKSALMLEISDAVLSYSSDRSRSVAWGVQGGSSSSPQGVWLHRDGDEDRFLGAAFSNKPLLPGDLLSRESAGGGGLGDPLERDPRAVIEDVVDDYVSVERARTDYGVVLTVVDPLTPEYALDEDATKEARDAIRSERRSWLAEPATAVAERYRAGELGILDVIRRYGVILHWGTGELLDRTTTTYRSMLERRLPEGW